MSEKEQTTEKSTVPELTREQYFKKIVSNHNKKTGFSFMLDELHQDESYLYAHATHTDGSYKITCQMDRDNEFMYALVVSITDNDASFHLDNETTKKQLETIMKSDAFKARSGALTLLVELRKLIAEESDRLTSNILEDSIAETEKQDAYDTITLAARKLLRTT